MADRFPIYRTYLIVIVVFEVGSVICAAAPTSAVFIAGRAIAGFGSAGIFTGSMMIMIPMVPLAKRPVFQGRPTLLRVENSLALLTSFLSFSSSNLWYGLRILLRYWSAHRRSLHRRRELEASPNVPFFISPSPSPKLTKTPPNPGGAFGSTSPSAASPSSPSSSSSTSPNPLVPPPP